ncbi:MAG TPA: heparan-alpha-glucosaminide N-acetyltransferase, partial [Casimicrobiaceae bacterium]|nr:heparan-alpha-glucosaminide N-acetyltransferase [Casimicrobiaceae bacterium]
MSRVRHDARRAARAIEPRRDATEPSAHGASPRARVEGLDALRGVAIVAMIVYHFCFDLRYFGALRADFEHDIRWLGARTLILSSFLLIAGISMVLARKNPAADARWWRHVVTVGGAALLVSVASWLVFPRSYIWFGVLHAIAVSLLIARPVVDRPTVAFIIGVVVIIAGVAWAHPMFDHR